MTPDLTAPATNIDVADLVKFLSIGPMTIQDGIGHYDPAGTSFYAWNFLDGLAHVTPKDNGGLTQTDPVKTNLDRRLSDLTDYMRNAILAAGQAVTDIDWHLNTTHHITESGLKLIVYQSDPYTQEQAERWAAMRRVTDLTLPEHLVTAIELALHLNHVEIDGGGYAGCNQGTEFCAEDYVGSLRAETSTSNAALNDALTDGVASIQAVWKQRVAEIVADFPSVGDIRIALLAGGPTFVCQSA